MMQIAQPLENHPLDFFLPPFTQLLMLGSFPPPKSRRSMDFFYPNFQNDMRRILGLIFYDDVRYFMTSNEKAFDEQKVKTFCTEKKIGIGDTAKQVIRLQGNASDDTLQVIQSFDIVEILQSLHHCTAVVVTGKKAMDTLMSVLQLSQQPAVGCSVSYEILGRVVKVYRMPSTSRAYPKPLAEKAEVYKNMFYEVGIK